MTTSKYLLAMLVASIRKELTIQKPEVVAVCSRKEETRQDRIFQAGVQGIGMFLLICAVMAWLVL